MQPIIFWTCIILYSSFYKFIAYVCSTVHKKDWQTYNVLCGRVSTLQRPRVRHDLDLWTGTRRWEACPLNHPRGIWQLLGGLRDINTALAMLSHSGGCVKSDHQTELSSQLLTSCRASLITIRRRNLVKKQRRINIIIMFDQFHTKPTTEFGVFQFTLGKNVNLLSYMFCA